jgi:hypothetical protein
MIAAERHELARLERLHADRDPVDAGRAPRREVGLGAIARVRLDRDLARRAAEPLPDPLDRSRDASGPPQRRGPAAEVDRDELAGERAGAQLELAQDRLEVGLVRWWTDLDREVTVRAQLAAPREVEVDA